jgi:hypothetical protein
MTAPSLNGAPSPPPRFVRLLSGIGAVVVFLIALGVSVGAVLGAPVGISLVRRRAERHNRHPNRIASLFGAVMASCVVATVIWGGIFALIPHPTQRELDKAAVETQTRPPPKLPAWYTKAFPQVATQAARTDSATEQLMRSPGFVNAMMAVGALIIGAFLGGIGGALGWCAWLLLGVATSAAREPLQ